MGNLVLVRHGQASFGSDDYDRLSPLGERQCRRLGEYWRERGVRFDAVLRGSLKRHQQSLDALLDALGVAPAVQVDAALDEYDSHAVIRTVFDGSLEPARTPEQVRGHFRLLREGLVRWARDEAAPQGMPRYADFAAGVMRALQALREHPGDVLVVSSGGPISTAVAMALRAPPETFVDLNMRLRNAALTELAATPRRLLLHSFNHLPHLDGAYADWITSA